jgi:IMP dehydrogenase
MALRGGLAMLRPSRSAEMQVAAVKKVKENIKASEQAKEESQGDQSCCDEKGRPRVGVVVHPGRTLLENVAQLVKAEADLLMLEASLGHGPELVAGVARIKEKFPDIPLIAGDVSDVPGTRATLEAGADGVKVGAPYILGLKVPLFTAIQECSRVVTEMNKVLVADVGTTELMMASSRVARALGAGACVAMAILEPASEEWKPQILAEGLDNLVEDVRMIMSCCGVKSVAELRRKARFVKVRGTAEA